MAEARSRHNAEDKTEFTGVGWFDDARTNLHQAALPQPSSGPARSCKQKRPGFSTGMGCFQSAKPGVGVCNIMNVASFGGDRGNTPPAGGGEHDELHGKREEPCRKGACCI